MERLAPFTLVRPASVAEAVAALAADATARPLAGGTDLVPNLRHGLGGSATLVDLAGLPGLAEVTASSAGLSLGAGVTLARLCADATVQAQLPALAAAAATVAAPAHRSVATLGGNLCLDTRCVFYNQSSWWRRANAYCLKYRGDTCHVAPQGRHCHAAYSGDLAPVLLAAEARVEIAGPQGPRTIGLDTLYVEDGAAHLALGPGEILVRVLVPPQPAAARLGYRKARVRAAIDFPLAGVAARVGIAGDRVAELRIALTGTNARPFLLAGTDAYRGRPLDDDVLAGLGRLVGKQVSPMRTTAMSGHYRRQVAAVLARRLVAELAGLSRRHGAGAG